MKNELINILNNIDYVEEEQSIIFVEYTNELYEKYTLMNGNVYMESDVLKDIYNFLRDLIQKTISSLYNLINKSKDTKKDYQEITHQTKNEIENKIPEEELLIAKKIEKRKSFALVAMDRLLQTGVIYGLAKTFKEGSIFIVNESLKKKYEKSNIQKNIADYSIGAILNRDTGEIEFLIEPEKYISIMEDVNNITEQYISDFIKKNNYNENNNIDYEKYNSSINKIFENIHDAMYNRSSTVPISKIDSLKESIKKLSNEFQKYNDFEDEIFKKSKEKQKKYDFNNKIGAYDNNKNILMNQQAADVGKLFDQLSKTVSDFIFWLKELINNCDELKSEIDSNDIIDHVHETHPTIITKSEKEFKEFFKYKIEDIDNLSPELINKLISPSIALYTDNNPNNKNLKRVSIVIPNFINVIPYFEKIIMKLNMIKQNMINAADAYDFKEYEYYNDMLQKILGKHWEKIYSYNVIAPIPKGSDDIEKLKKSFEIDFFPYTNKIKSIENKRFFHFSSNSNIQSLNPTHKNKHNGYIYSKNRVYFLMIDQSTSQGDIDDFKKNYGNNVYEYIPQKNDCFYIDTSTIFHFINGIVDNFIPVFIETENPLQITKIDDLELEGDESMMNEDRLFEKLCNASKTNLSDNDAISDIINQTLKNNGQIYLSTDWHLGLNSKSQNRDLKIEKMINKCVKQKDCLIFLGDLVDGEFRNKDKLKNFIKSYFNHIKHKIFIRGNNDLFTDEFYISCGFEKCVNSFEYKSKQHGRILFSHIPQKTSCDINIHGHLHNKRIYWVPYKKHIDVASYGGRLKPIKLNDLIKHIPSYAKTIKEDPAHFSEGYLIKMENGKFFTNDPFYDFLTDEIYD